MPKLKTLLRVLGVLLLVAAILGLNGGIYYSSVPHYEQMGWAMFCSLNALWVAIVGLACFILAESNELAMRQLDRDQQRERAAA